MNDWEGKLEKKGGNVRKEMRVVSRVIYSREEWITVAVHKYSIGIDYLSREGAVGGWRLELSTKLGSWYCWYC